MTTTTICHHMHSAHVATRGVVGWSPVDTYKCDDCGDSFDIQTLDPTWDDDVDEVL